LEVLTSTTNLPWFMNGDYFLVMPSCIESVFQQEFSA